MQDGSAKQMGTLELVGRTIDNLSALIDKQVQLVMLEIREELSTLLRGGSILIGGLVSLFLMIIALILAGIMALSAVMPGWLAALIFAAAFLLVGAILALIGLSRMRIRPLGRTIDTIREDTEWARQRLKSNGK